MKAVHWENRKNTKPKQTDRNKTDTTTRERERRRGYKKRHRLPPLRIKLFHLLPDSLKPEWALFINQIHTCEKWWSLKLCTIITTVCLVHSNSFIDSNNIDERCWTVGWHTLATLCNLFGIINEFNGMCVKCTTIVVSDAQLVDCSWL